MPQWKLDECGLPVTLVRELPPNSFQWELLWFRIPSLFSSYCQPVACVQRPESLVRLLHSIADCDYCRGILGSNNFPKRPRYFGRGRALRRDIPYLGCPWSGVEFEVKTALFPSCPQTHRLYWWSHFRLRLALCWQAGFSGLALSVLLSLCNSWHLFFSGRVRLKDLGWASFEEEGLSQCWLSSHFLSLVLNHE